MQLNQANLQALFRGFNTNFQQGYSSLGDNASLFEQLCTVVPSNTAVEVYPWLRQLPRMREWLGDRVIHSLGAGAFSIRNRKFELTEGVSRDSIEDDTYGLYGPMMQEMGRSSREHPNELTVEMLATNPMCFDGQQLFDAEHPVLDKNGKETSVSNDMGGTGSAWYVMDLTRAIRPIVFQRRRDYQFRSITNLNDSEVFMKDNFLFGVDARVNVGPGLWQLIVRSNQPFTPESYAAARARLTTLKGDYERPLALRHSHTMVPQSMEGDALEILNSERIEGSSNKWRGTSSLVLNPWLPSAA
ncbi:Mu-like prophage major head subunit gpT family protein [Salinicola sp. JS01]|uniref:Mu-like prophage major head subunit gpT family protein n=1 Tax=Salinicola sp. JS01 TaxID=3050071 RepID=UPI00255B4C55|nr:Mu-like prophage major head subunit gpT family protein [Salinicola sp. JS01]WIX31245.1 Mu-like prophage major head subunit gpT family protein [Salinicola sp. JS01]